LYEPAGQRIRPALGIVGDKRRGEKQFQRLVRLPLPISGVMLVPQR